MPDPLRGRRSILRLLDANANRALEGMRVCEEIVRFHLESPHLFRRARALRHAIAHTVDQLPMSTVELVRARESGHDVGRRASASRVDSLERLLLINFQRVKESLRTLEECARLIAPRQMASFQRLRFHTYEVERDFLLELATLRRR
jgi:thiamine-phosphate pyrophosphorylase